MPKSIVQNLDDRCFICGRFGGLHTHHIFYGAGLRKVSDKFGLTVRLCPYCHLYSDHAVHKNRKTDLWLKRLGQEAYMETYHKNADEFRSHFRKNYLEENNNGTQS